VRANVGHPGVAAQGDPGDFERLSPVHAKISTRSMHASKRAHRASVFRAMRLVYIDVDTLRADHLGCYGYGRPVSPNLDRLAQQAVLFERCYASDVPCLPSRTALFSGRFGTHNGVVGHGGTAAEPFVEGRARGFSSTLARTSWPAVLRKLGMRTASISSFAARHGAHHFAAGFDELMSPGKLGLESADEVCAFARDWLDRNGARPAWFLHVQLWDPHTPYRAPDAFGDPFADAPLPAWLTDEVRARHFAAVGPHSAQEAVGFSTDYPYGAYPRQPRQMASLSDVRAMFDGYDTAVRFADEHIGKLLARLAELGLADHTAVLVSSDHGEALGELNVYGDHHTADEPTAHVPCFLRWPGLSPRRLSAFCYQLDVAATIVELAGGSVPDAWDGRSFADPLRAGRDEGRGELVITQGAWTCQRSVRWQNYLAIRTWHDGYHAYEPWMIFDVTSDPHEQHDLSATQPELLREAEYRLEAWQRTVMQSSDTGIDPLHTVLAEGGPAHTRGRLRSYAERLRATGRAAWAERLERAHPDELS
jgi:choline-sulfatase